VTAAPVVGRQVTPGHPLSYSTLRNARSAEWLAATRESRQRREPEHCDDCAGWHLAADRTDTTNPNGA
jgi:hypothetical protein